MWLNLQDAAKYLAVSRATMYRLLKAGHVRGHEVPGVRGLRFRSEELDAVPVPVDGARQSPAKTAPRKAAPVSKPPGRRRVRGLDL